MNTNLIVADRLAVLDQIELHNGGHGSFEQGHCFNEAAAWLAGEPHSDAPKCVSPVLRRYTMRLNDRWDDQKRQQLHPYLARVIGTGSDGKDELREQIATQFLCDRLLGPWLALAGMTAELEQLKTVATASRAERRNLLRRIRDAAWALRAQNLSDLRAKVREHLKDQPEVAAVAAAVAVAEAAVAAEVAEAVAAAAAEAAEVAAVAEDRSYSVAYKAAHQYYREHPLPISQQIADLGAAQDPIALELLEAMIDPQGPRP